MKTIMKKLSLALCAVLMVAAMAACSSQSPNAEVGKYTFASLEAQGITVGADGLAQMGQEEIGTWYIELEDGGKAHVYFASRGDFEGDYTVSGETVSITIDGESQSFDLKEGVLSADLDSAVVNFKR